jgi:hypothetical protein
MANVAGAAVENRKLESYELLLRKVRTDMIAMDRNPINLNDAIRLKARSMHICIIDDQDERRAELFRNMELMGFLYITECDQQNFMRVLKLQPFKYELCLLQGQSSEVAMSMLFSLKSEKLLSHIPIGVIVSPNTSKSGFKRWVETGADLFLFPNELIIQNLSVLSRKLLDACGERPSALLFDESENYNDATLQTKITPSTVAGSPPAQHHDKASFQMQKSPDLSKHASEIFEKCGMTPTQKVEVLMRFSKPHVAALFPLTLKKWNLMLDLIADTAALVGVI